MAETTQLSANGITIAAALYKPAFAQSVPVAIQSALDRFVTPQSWLAGAETVADATSAFTRMFADGARHILLDLPTYTLGDVALPDDAVFWGFAPGQNPTVKTGSQLKAKAGAAGIFQAGGAQGCVFNGVTFDGNAKASAGIAGSATYFQLLHCVLHSCSFGNGGVGDYWNVARFLNTIVRNCGSGINNLVDSEFDGGFIAQCSTAGIYLRSGANDNIFKGFKVEFNTGFGIKTENTVDNQISLINCDRNYKAGLHDTGSTRLKVSDANFNRNGRNGAVAGERSQVYLEGTTSSSLNLIQTFAQGDDGTGLLPSPQFGVEYGAGCVDVSINGGDWRGFTGSGSAAINGSGNLTGALYRGARGITDAG